KACQVSGVSASKQRARVVPSGRQSRAPLVLLPARWPRASSRLKGRNTGPYLRYWPCLSRLFMQICRGLGPAISTSSAAAASNLADRSASSLQGVGAPLDAACRPSRHHFPPFPPPREELVLALAERHRQVDALKQCSCLLRFEREQTKSVRQRWNQHA